MISVIDTFDEIQQSQIQMYDCWVYDNLRCANLQGIQSMDCLKRNFMEKKFHVYPCFVTAHWFLSIVEFHPAPLNSYPRCTVWVYDSIYSNLRAIEAGKILSAHFEAGFISAGFMPNTVQFNCVPVETALQQKDGFNCGPFTILNCRRFFEERRFVLANLGSIQGPEELRRSIRMDPNHVLSRVQKYFSSKKDNGKNPKLPFNIPEK